MAHSKEQWERAKAYFEAGQHNPQQISDIVGIERSSIVKKAKIHNWKSCENSDYIEAKQTIAVKKSQLNSQTLQILDDIADEKIRHKKLIYGNAELIASQIPQIISGMVERKKDEKTGEVTEVYLITPKDIKELAEANDKLAITLKVADRHSSQQINVQTNTQVNSTTILTEEDAKKKALELGVPLEVLIG